LIYQLTRAGIRERIKKRETPIAFIGLGRVGLPLAATLADKGFSVTGVDIKQDIVDIINSGTNPYEDEEGLSELIARATSSGRLKAAKSLEEAAHCEIFIIAVPTLIKGTKPDISAVESVANQLSQIITPGKLVVLQSTVPPHTTEEVLGATITRNSGLVPGRDFGLAYSPERTQSPQVLRDLASYPKIIGGIDGKSALILVGVYASFAPSVLKMRAIVYAEVTKLAENSYRDVNISFANEIALLCMANSIYSSDIIKAANTHTSCHILQPGLVGGHCIPMDPYYIIDDAAKRGLTPLLIQTARNLNESMFDLVVKLCGEKTRSITILGLSFKPDVKSFDTSHTLKLVSKLEAKGYQVTVHDPFLGDEQFSFPVEKDLYRALEGADCLILSTAHSSYGGIDFSKVKQVMQGNRIIDVRNFFDMGKLTSLGFNYRGLGRSGND